MTAPAGGRSAYDPFAPPAPAFPEARLRRAGVEGESLDRARAEFDGMDREQREEFAGYIASQPDEVINQRFVGTRSRSELEAMTVDDLHPLLRERGLSIQGRKAELIDRLTAAYEAPRGALSGEQIPEVRDTSGDAPEAASGPDSDNGAAATETADAAPAPDAEEDPNA